MSIRPHIGPFTVDGWLYQLQAQHVFIRRPDGLGMIGMYPLKYLWFEVEVEL